MSYFLLSNNNTFDGYSDFHFARKVGDFKLQYFKFVK